MKERENIHRLQSNRSSNSGIFRKKPKKTASVLWKYLSISLLLLIGFFGVMAYTLSYKFVLPDNTPVQSGAIKQLKGITRVH